MQASKLTIRSIRGFNSERSFELGDRLTIIGGANGSGKSSLCEAWDWIYSNETIAEHLEPRNELKHGFKNLHATAAQAPHARIELKDGTARHFIERAAGVLAHDLPAAPPALSPVILQYRLQRAIYTSDGDRAAFFTTVLGLEAAHKLVKRLESLARLTDKEGATAVAKWNTIATEATKLGHVFPHKHPSSSAQVDANETTLLQFVAGLLKSAASEAEVIMAIKKEAHATTSAEVSVTKLVPSTLLALDAAKSLQAGAEALQAILKIDKESAARSAWLSAGLKIAKPNTCPFCGEPTLTPERIQLVEKQRDESSEAAAALSALESAVRRARALADAGDAPTIAKLETELTRVSEAAKELDATRRALVDEPVTAASAAITAWKTRPADQSEELRFAAAMQLIDAMNKLNAACPSMDAALQDRLRPITIAKLKIATLLYLEDPERATWKKRLDDSVVLTATAQAAKEEFDALVQANADEIRDAIVKWYKILRPHDTTPLSSLNIETTRGVKVRVIAETHGVSGPASAIFSHSNVNALGMSCYLARLLKAGHRTVVLDDPTQALDPANRFTFERTFVKALLDEGLQVVILTHDATTARSLWDEYQDFSPVGYAFEGHTAEGPIVRPLYGEPDHLIRRALEALESGDNARLEEAALPVRKLGEQAVAEFLRFHKAPFPEKVTFGVLVGRLDTLGAGKTPTAACMKRLNEINTRISTPLHHPQTQQAMSLTEVADDLREIIDMRKQMGQLKFEGASAWPTTPGLKERLQNLTV